VFIPDGEPQFNGGVENSHGWFQEPLFDRRFRRPGDLLLRKLPASFVLRTGRLPQAAGA
jgi:hypothetical protein